MAERRSRSTVEIMAPLDPISRDEIAEYMHKPALSVYLDFIFRKVPKHYDFRVVEAYLVRHSVSVNWRQAESQKMQRQSLEEALRHYDPEGIIRLYDGEDLNLMKTKGTFKDRMGGVDVIPIDWRNITLDWLLKRQKEDQVWSLYSRVECSDGKPHHLPMMNFHPDKDVRPIYDSQTILGLEEMIAPTLPCVVVETDRFHHLFGLGLLEDESALMAHIAQHNMPTVLTSPRYGGHGLFDRGTTLRVTYAKGEKVEIKKKLPTVVEYSLP